MSEKLTVLLSTKEAYGGIARRILYYYTITPKIKNFLNQDVSPQSSNELPADAVNFLVQADKDAISAGNAGFEVFQHYQTAGETDTAFKTRLLADHAVRQAWWIQDKKDKYSLAGYATSV